MSVGDAYELRGEEPETIKQLVEDVRSGAAAQPEDCHVPAGH